MPASIKYKYSTDYEKKLKQKEKHLDILAAPGGIYYLPIGRINRMRATGVAAG